MSSGFTSGPHSGADIDTLFKARLTSARANTGLKVGSQDLADRFEKSYSSSDWISTATGFTSGGTDIRQLFMDISQDLSVTVTGGNIQSLSSPQHFTTGDTYSFTVTATGYGTLSYQWRWDGVPIPGETSSTFNFTAGGASAGAGLDCEISNEWNSITSNSIIVIINTPATVTVSFSGSTSVPAGGTSSDGSWTYSATSSDGTLKRYRFYIVGHSAGAWTNTPGMGLTGTDFGVSGGFTWGAPMGSPDIYASPGGPYDFVFEAEDIHGNSDSKTISVTVT